MMAAAVALGVDGSFTYASGEHVGLLRARLGVVVEPAPEFPAPLERFSPELSAWWRALTAFLARHRGLGSNELESALRSWWRGENRALRRAMEKSHRARCERGRGVLVNRVSGEVIRARCKSWRECDYWAFVYGRSVQKLWEQLKRVRAFVVFTMPAERGDWTSRENLRAQAAAKRRLEERFFRKFGHRFAMLWAREHNTHGGGSGRLHLNVLWDEDWVDQSWLSETAAAVGFGAIVNISRVGAGARLRDGDGRGAGVHRYALKAIRYASKDASSQADWPRGTRRWAASRSARAQMKRPDKNPDWFWSPVEPPTLPLRPAELTITVDEGSPYERAPGCVCRTTFCRCGAAADFKAGRNPFARGSPAPPAA